MKPVFQSLFYPVLAASMFTGFAVAHYGHGNFFYSAVSAAFAVFASLMALTVAICAPHKEATPTPENHEP